MSITLGVFQLQLKVIMLLNKYEKFAVIGKDAYAEEILFKIEKNFTNFATL